MLNALAIEVEDDYRGNEPRLADTRGEVRSLGSRANKGRLVESPLYGK
jgi:hypothetical protein